MRIDSISAELLRSAVAARVGIPGCAIAQKGKGHQNENFTFRRYVCAELLRRQGLTIEEIGVVMCWQERSVQEALRIIADRAKFRAFREYINGFVNIYDDLAGMVWREREAP